jgi:hypothetical protein
MKFLPPRFSSRARRSAGISFARMIFSQLSGVPFLRAEVVVDRGEVHPGAGGELAQAGGLEAVLHEQPLRGIEDAGLGVLGGEVARHALAGRSGCTHV